MDNMRNIIRLKDVPSNTIEEAIIIFKNNKKVKKHEFSNKFNSDNHDEDDERDFIVKEAELVISDYLKETQDNKVDYKKKNKRLKCICTLLGIMLFISIIF